MRSWTRAGVVLSFVLFVLVPLRPAVGEELHFPSQFATLQAAIDAAEDGDEIVVAQGVHNTGGASLDGKAITIRSTDPSDPIVLRSTILTSSGPLLVLDSGETNQTVFQGLTFRGTDGGGPLVVDGSSPEFHGCRFVSDHTGPTASASLIGINAADPFVIRCDFEGWSTNEIGAIMLIESSASIVSCTFTASSGIDLDLSLAMIDNSVFVNSTIHASTSSTVVMTNCYLTGESAGIRSSNSHYQVDGCIFEFAGSTSRWSDPPIQISGSSLTMRRSEMRDCSAERNAPFYASVSEITLFDCRFSRNHVYLNTSLASTMFLNKCLLSADSCVFEDNWWGYAVLNTRDSYLEITDSSFTGNSGYFASIVYGRNSDFELTRTEVQGNLTYEGPTFRLYSESSLDVSDSVIACNSGHGIVSITGQRLSFNSIALCANSSGGWLIDADVDEFEITNSIVAENTPSAVFNVNSSLPNAQRCVLQPGTGLTAVGNTIANAMFARSPDDGGDGWGDDGFTDNIDESINDDFGDLRPAPNSPVIDAADTTMLGTDSFDADGDGDRFEPYPFDLAGQPRLVDDTGIDDTGVPDAGSGLTADIGPYEFQFDSPNACDADLTTQNAPIGDPAYGQPDGITTAADIQYFVNGWFTGDTSIGDMTTQGAAIGQPGFGVPDGQVDTADIQYYINLWLGGCP